jgi:hypothetical protein
VVYTSIHHRDAIVGFTERRSIGSDLRNMAPGEKAGVARIFIVSLDF